jgi:hypothetical protein
MGRFAFRVPENSASVLDRSRQRPDPLTHLHQSIR